MVSPSPQRPVSDASQGRFTRTQWSVVLDIRGGDERRRVALERLCRTYWPPVYSYLRRRGHAPADAEDTTQAFFAHLMAGSFLDRSDPARGRFRGYLVSALRQFVSRERAHATAQKRGGTAPALYLSQVDVEEEFAAIDHDGLDPSEAYELSWAVTLLNHSLRRLEEEQAAAGRGQIFATLKPFLHHPPSTGDYERAAQALQTSRATVAVWLHRLTRRLAEILKLEVTATLEQPEHAEEELQHLLQVFRR